MGKTHRGRAGSPLPAARPYAGKHDNAHLETRPAKSQVNARSVSAMGIRRPGQFLLHFLGLETVEF